MESVKFVPPGGHRACLSCSAAKAKCVFSDDAEVGGSGGDALGFITGGPDDFINTSASDMQTQSSSFANGGGAGGAGTPAIPRCQRCERLNRDCLLPTRPRKKRRVGTLKPGMRAGSSTFSVTPQPQPQQPQQPQQMQTLTQKTSFSNLSTTSLDPGFSPAKPARMPSMPNMRSSVPPTQSQSMQSVQSQGQSAQSAHNTPKRSPVTPITFPYQPSQKPPPLSQSQSQSQLQQHPQQQYQSQPPFSQQQIPSIASIQQQPPHTHMPTHNLQNMHMSSSMSTFSSMSTKTTTMQSFGPPSPGVFNPASMTAPATIDPSRLRPFGSPPISQISTSQWQQQHPPPQHPPPPIPQIHQPPSQIYHPQPPLSLPTPQASHASQTGYAPHGQAQSYAPGGQTPGPLPGQTLGQTPGPTPGQTPAQTPAAQTPGQTPGPTAPSTGTGVSPPQISALSQPGAQNPHQMTIDSVFQMDEREAEELLRFYRDAYSSFNPYMEPPPVGMRVAELQAQKPLVWIGVVFVTSFHDFERQNKLGRAIIYYLTDRLYQNSVKSLDLLQGLLVFLNWFIAQNFVLPQFTNLIHMAMALVTDLGLNKLEFIKTSARSPLDQYVAKTIHGPDLRAPDEGHTLEERRALAGGFCLSHAMSDSIIMVTPLQYSLQLEDTCRLFEATYLRKKSASPGGPYTLGTAAAAPIAASTIADYHLAITVRLYYLIARVLQVQRDADLCGGHFAVPVRQHIDNFTSELTRLWSGLPQETQSDFKVKLLYYTAEVYIYELSLATQTTPFKANSTPSRESDDGSSSVSVSTHNHIHQYPQESDIPGPIRCYLALKQFFDIFLTLPVNLYHQFPVTLFTQLVHADLTLAKLTAYFRGNARPQGVPEGVTLPLFTETIEAVASRFARVRTVPHPLGYTVRNIIYDAFAARLRSFKMLDLAGRRKNAKAAKKAAKAAAAANAANASNASHSHANLPLPAKRLTPPSNDVLSINNLIGNVPRAPEGMQIDLASSQAPAPTYPSVEMDVERDYRDPRYMREIKEEDELEGMDDIVVEDAMISSVDIDEMMEYSGGSDEMDEMEEQAEWWNWYKNLQTSLMGPPPGSTAPSAAPGGPSAPGAGPPGGPSGAGAAAVAAQLPHAPPAAPGSGVTPGTASASYSLTVPSFNTTERHRGPGSVTSIDSLLNNRDQEPNLDTYMMGR